MNKDLNKHRLNTFNNANSIQAENKSELKDVHQELHKFNETKQSIADLIKYRAALLDVKNTEFLNSSSTEEDFKEKAMDAIDNLFSSESESE